MSKVLQEIIKQLASGKTLDSSQSAAAFSAVMSGESTPAQMAALLMALRVRGETPAEVAGAATALRDVMLKLDYPDNGELVDTCGTGGGSVTTFNISTASALLAAGAGVKIAKHGNRSFTSRSGSADVLEALGVPIDVPVQRMRSVLDEAGIVFMFAPTMHPAMRHVGPVRRELAIATVMNLVGPLANPAGAGRQVIGVADGSRLELIAGALKELGTRHSLVVHGELGMDEISPVGSTTVVEIKEGVTGRWEIDPERFGYAGIDISDLGGGDPAENALMIEQILMGKGTPGGEAAVVMNAAAAIYVSGLASTYEDGVVQAKRALGEGKGWEALGKLRRAASLAQ